MGKSAIIIFDMKCLLLIVLANAFVAAVAAAGQVLHSLGEINDFIEDSTPRKVPFEVTGKVLSAFRSPKAGEIILSDEFGVRAELYRPLDLTQPIPGDIIKACGFASMGKTHEPFVNINEFTVLGHGTRPDPVPVRLSETNATSNHLMVVRTEGVVIDAFPDEIDRRYMILILKDRDVVVPVSFLRDVFGDRSDLVDATIRVTGVYRRSVSGTRKFSWPNIHPLVPEDIEIVTPPPADPFSVPPIENRLYLTSEDIASMSKRSIVGEVLATWSGDQAMVRATDGRIVNLKLANGQTLPACGATIVAAGQPETDLFRINLSAVRWKDAAPLPRTGTNETAEAVTDAALWDDNGLLSIRGEAHGRLISARGIVRTLPSPDETDLRFVLDAGDLSIPVDATSNPAALDGLAIGSEIQVTGRCILLTETRQKAYGSARVKGFALVIRSPADIVVLRRPSWWTPMRLTVVISILLAALIAIYVWNRILQRLVNRRGRELYREQVAHAISEFKTGERTRLAVELHDSLSQSLSGVACHLAVGDETLATDPAAARRYIATARKMLNACRTELRQCLFDLRSDTLEEKDFSEAIRKALDQIDGDASITVDFDVPRTLFPDTTAHAILAIVRELAGNAVRHGKATEVKVLGAIEDGRITFSVRDNGRGFDPANCAGPLEGHFGLAGIRNRLEKLGGTFAIDSAPGAGAKATIVLPLPATHTQKAREP